VEIAVHWQDEEGTARSCAVTEWLANAKEDGKALPNRFVFIGSEIRYDGRYAAEEDTGIISVTNLSSAVLDVPFQSSRSMDERLFSSARASMPKPGTAARLVIRPRPGAEKSPYARALLEIDARGRMQIDGQRIRLGEIRRWAHAFASDHIEGLLQIRLYPDTPAGYAPQAQLEAKLGGVYYFETQLVPPAEPMLPRTSEQLTGRLREWEGVWAHPEEEIVAPADQTAAALSRVEAERERLRALEAVLSEYETALRRRLAEEGPVEGAPAVGAQQDAEAGQDPPGQTAEGGPTP
jgi:hypothetical protein